jgi:putative membrane protein
MGFNMLMSEHPYDHYNGIEKQNLILRDYLAIDRTVMANESSFLSYIRTALTMVVAAITFLKFFDSTTVHILGWIFIVAAVLMVVHGATRYEAVERILHNITDDMQNHPDIKHRGPARRLIVASQSLIRLFR